MSRCDRFEREGILRLEQGLSLDAHFGTCPDCRDAQATYQRLQEAIAQTGSGSGPRAGWEDRVWQEVQKRHRSSVAPSGVLYLRWAAAAALVMAVGAPLIWSRLRPESPGAATIRVEVHQERSLQLRGSEARPGDGLLLEATSGGALYSEMRLYLNDADLVLRCSEEPPCERHGDQVRATAIMSSVGRYQAVLLSSASPIPPPSGEGLDADAGRARRAGAAIQLPEEVRVH